MTLKNGHNEFAGWIIHLQAAIEGDPLGYNAPAAKYDSPAVTYDNGQMPRQWVTLDCQVTQVTCNLGGQLAQIPGVVGSLGRLTADLYDPNRTLDPASTTYELLMRPGAGIRLTATQPVTGAIWPLWTGMAETFEHNLKTGTGRLVASDLTALFTGVDMVWERPAETSVQRLQAVRAVMPNPIPLTFSGTATALSNARFAGNLWTSVIENTQRAEQSIIWVDAAGILRRTETQGLGPPIRATDCDDGVSPIVYYELTSVIDDDLLTNIIQVERTNLPQNVDRQPLWYSNPDSVNYNGPHSLTQTTLPLPDDTALRDWALRVLSLRSTPKAAVTGLVVTIADVFPWVGRTVPAIVGLSVADILDITMTSRGEAERWVVAVAGISHTITPQDWDVAIEVVDGPRLTENWGYNHAQSVYGTSVYAAQAGVVGPSAAQIEAAIISALSEEAMA